MNASDDPVSTIRNLGPAVEAACARAGIHSAKTLRDLGADAGYAVLLSSGMQPHFVGYYAMVMGLQGRPWNDCHGDEKAALRIRFDHIKSASQAIVTHQNSDDRMDRALAEIGVIPRDMTSQTPS